MTGVICLYDFHKTFAWSFPVNLQKVNKPSGNPIRVIPVTKLESGVSYF
jgi:hypothetical protein